MSRQQAIPVLLGDSGGLRLNQLQLGSGPDQISEADLQALLHDHPECLPIDEVDALFANPIAVCRELSTPAGPLDNLMITPSGLPIIIECKLWRNPQARREVVGQIIDYAKAIARWTSSDLQREVSKCTGRSGNVLVDLLREAGHTIDEIGFNDALTNNLRRGRFLLLIVGDGIREGVEAIAEYLQDHAGLHFSLGLVEMPIFLLPSGEKLFIPRVLARTTLITRTVVAVPEGLQVQEPSDDDVVVLEEADPTSRIVFWTDFLKGLVLDDPEQAKPKPGRNGFVSFSMPAPAATVWLVAYRSEAHNEVGVYLSYARDSVGARVNARLIENWEDIAGELGGSATVQPDRSGRPLMQDSFRTGAWTIPSERERALAWLRTRTNDFVNVLRPRVRSAVEDLGDLD